MSRARDAAPLRKLRTASLAIVLALAALPIVANVASAAPAKSGLPRLASTVQPPPEAASVTELEQALAQVASGKEDERKAGQLRLKEGGAALLPAMGKKIAELRKSMNRDLVGILITDARKGHGKKDDDEKGKKKKGDKEKKEDDASSDWLQMVVEKAKPGDAAYKDLVAVLAIERTLVDVGTTPAVRELVDVYAAFGDLFRIDVQHMIARLGDKAVPALLEAKKHDVEKVRRWASRQLDALGRAIPGEAVQIADPEVLADVLRAYGRTKDIDALRVVVSFTSSDRVHVREAAREALVSYGDAALWQLREAFESLTGKRPLPGVTWDKLAADLFDSYDRARLEEIYGMFEEGVSKQKDGKLEEMAQLFDQVLARAPGFEKRTEMVDGYFALAKSIDGKDPQRALLYARKALRLDPSGPQGKTIQSWVLTLEGEEHVAHGVAETASFKRALSADAGNDRAKSDLARVESNPSARAAGAYRYLGAAAVGLVGTIAALFVGLFRRQRPGEDHAA